MSLRPSIRPLRRLLGIGAASGLLSLAGGWVGPARQDEPAGVVAFWTAGIPRPIAVRNGRAMFRVPGQGPGSQTLVVVSALSPMPGPFPVRLTARPTTVAAIPETADDGRAAGQPPETSPAITTPPQPRTTPARSPGASPPRDRVFHLMVRDGDPGSPGNYLAVPAVLKGVGHRVQVYVASEDLARVGRGTLEDAITIFDDRIEPLARSFCGAARDVDGDGRFTILFSSWLDRLGGGRHAVDGFVRVADLDATVTAPFGNRCDMMYLNAGLQAGPYLRTVLAHEYMHAVVYSRKALDQADRDGPGPEEEGWLDEAIAHLAEDLHGFSPSNIDYRVSAFLSCPERYRLVVDDYFAADLFRSHGNRGSTYLFLRWCVDRYGRALVPALLRSPRRGIGSVESATGSTFAALYRRWSVALFLAGMDPPESAADARGDGFRSADLRSPSADRELAGPRYRRLTPGVPQDRWEAVGTSSHFVVLEGGGSAAIEVEVVAPPAAELQVTALPLGHGHTALTVSLQATRRAGEMAVRARVAEHHGVPVRLTGLSWEPLVPGTRPHVEGRHSGRLDLLGIASAFGTSALPARGELRSRPIPLADIAPETGPIVFKLVGTDFLGRRVSAWADLDAATSGPAGDP
jgi:hypothetical protein